MSMTIDLISSGDVGIWKVFKCIKSFWALDVLLKDPVTEKIVMMWIYKWWNWACKVLVVTELQIGTFFSSQVCGENCDLESAQISDFLTWK